MDLGKGQPSCEECRGRYAVVMHEPTNMYLCEPCVELYEVATRDDADPPEIQVDDLEGALLSRR